MREGLFKTTIVIWSGFNPEEMDIEDLSREALIGGAYCSKQVHESVVSPEDDEEWNDEVEEFFSSDVAEEKEE